MATRWAPDTCDCVIDYEMDGEELIIIDSVLCLEHVGQDPYSVIQENRMKNMARNEIVKHINEDEIIFLKDAEQADRLKPFLEQGLTVLTIEKGTRRIKIAITSIKKDILIAIEEILTKELGDKFKRSGG